MDKKTAIKQAKKIAKQDYEDAMKKVGAFNPDFKRDWRKVNITSEAYALNGTPDKAVVFVLPKRNEVVAVRMDSSIVKRIKFEECKNSS